MTPEAHPVTARRTLAYVADWVAADQLGEREDLGDGQQRPFRRVPTLAPASGLGGPGRHAPALTPSCR